MKVFLMSDLVVHELVSMQLEGKWLTAAQFAESAQLWIARHGKRNQLSKQMLEVFQREAEQIAGRLMKEAKPDGTDSPLKRLLLDISAVNYADPLSASALAASLEVCRAKLCDGCFARIEPGDAKELRETEQWCCHPALRQFLCGGIPVHDARDEDRHCEAGGPANTRKH